MILGKRNLCLIGGSSELGRMITKKFNKSRFNKWRVFNIDFEENTDANKNFILPQENTYSTSTLE